MSTKTPNNTPQNDQLNQKNITLAKLESAIDKAQHEHTNPVMEPTKPESSLKLEATQKPTKTIKPECSAKLEATQKPTKTDVGQPAENLKTQCTAGVEIDKSEKLRNTSIPGPKTAKQQSGVSKMGQSQLTTGTFLRRVRKGGIKRERTAKVTKRLAGVNLQTKITSKVQEISATNTYCNETSELNDTMCTFDDDDIFCEEHEDTGCCSSLISCLTCRPKKSNTDPVSSFSLQLPPPKTFRKKGCKPKTATGENPISDSTKPPKVLAKSSKENSNVEKGPKQYKSEKPTIVSKQPTAPVTK